MSADLVTERSTALSLVTRSALTGALCLAFLDLSAGGVTTFPVSVGAAVLVAGVQVLTLIPAFRAAVNRLPFALAGVALIALSMPFANPVLILLAAALLSMGWDGHGRALAPLFSSVFLVLIASTRTPIDGHGYLLAGWAILVVVTFASLTVGGNGGGAGGSDGWQEGRRWREVFGVVVVAGLLVPPVMALLADGSPVALSRRGESGRSASAYWGFEEDLDTGTRGRLGDEIVLRVRADQPDFWRAQAFSEWDGRRWSRGVSDGTELGGDVVIAPRAIGDLRGLDGTGGAPVEEFNQTFTMDRAGGDVLFGAYRVAVVDGPFDRLRWEDDGSLRSTRSLGRGTVYNVTSWRPVVTADRLRAADPRLLGVPREIQLRYLGTEALSDPAAALAQGIAGSAPTSYDAAAALSQWFDENIEYDRDIPELAVGEDTVDRLLAERKGYCEQIATTFALWLRELGIPARVTVGYAPGERNPLTGEWIVRERDAHAWVEAFFPGIGWQSFDPTMGVPLSGEAPEAETAAATRAVFWAGRGVLVVGMVLGALWLALGGFRTLAARRRPRSLVEQAAELADRLVRAGTRAGVERPVAATLSEYAALLATHGWDDPRLEEVVHEVESVLFDPAYSILSVKGRSDSRLDARSDARRERLDDAERALSAVLDRRRHGDLPRSESTRR